MNNRENLIMQIVKASRIPCPEVVASTMQRHKVTGKRYSIFGMPFNFNPEDYETINVGFCFRAKDGTTYGTVRITPEACYLAHAEHENFKADAFKRELEQMTDEELESQAGYWLKSVNA